MTSERWGLRPKKSMEKREGILFFHCLQGKEDGGPEPRERQLGHQTRALCRSKPLRGSLGCLKLNDRHPAMRIVATNDGGFAVPQDGHCQG